MNSNPSQCGVRSHTKFYTIVNSWAPPHPRAVAGWGGRFNRVLYIRSPIALAAPDPRRGNMEDGLQVWPKRSCVDERGNLYTKPSTSSDSRSCLPSVVAVLTPRASDRC